MKSTSAWMFWLITILIFLFSTRNPIYLLVSLVGLFCLGRLLSKSQGHTNWFKQNLLLLFIMVLVSGLITALFTHNGQTILLSLPEFLPLVSGNITLESLIYGAINGLIIGCMFILFSILNLALSIKQITHLIPRAFYPVAMITTIALTFFPSIQRRFREIKEAQMIRGNLMKKMSDWLPILVPLLVSSLENGLTLSESMTSRGFYTVESEEKSIGNTIVIIIGVFFIFAGWILSIYDYPAYIYIPLIFLGGFTVLFSLWCLGRKVKTSRYQKEDLRNQDFIALGFIALVLLSYGFSIIQGNLSSLAYSPYPSLSFPNLEILPMFPVLLAFFPLTFEIHDRN